MWSVDRRRTTNQYFLAIVIIVSIPAISPLPSWSAIAPLVFVLVVGMAKEAFEDIKRRKSDALANSLEYQVQVALQAHYRMVTRQVGSGPSSLDILLSVR